MFRRLPPAHSPVSLRSVAAGLGSLIRGGGRARGQLRDVLRRQYGAGEVLLLDSGTSALRIALRALGEGGSRPLRVALPAFSCYDVATAAVGAGAEPLFYDVDPEGLTPDLASLRSALGRGARAVVVAHLYGLPVAWDAVSELARRHGAVLVEDAAQGWGARYRERRLGGLGDLSVLSFGRGKGVTGGSGGALLVRARGHTEPVRAAAAELGRGGRGWGDLARLVGQWVFGRPALYGLPASLPWLGLGETPYRRPRPAARGTDVSMGALVPQLGEAVRAEAEIRRANGRRLRGLISEVEGLSVPAVPEGGVSGDLRLPVLAADASRPLLASREARKLGVMPGYPSPLPGLEEAWPGGEAGRGFPGADRLARGLFTLPCHRYVTDDDCRRLGALLREAGALASPERALGDAPGPVTEAASSPSPEATRRRA